MALKKQTSYSSHPIQFSARNAKLHIFPFRETETDASSDTLSKVAGVKDCSAKEKVYTFTQPKISVYEV